MKLRLIENSVKEYFKEHEIDYLQQLIVEKCNPFLFQSQGLNLWRGVSSYNGIGQIKTVRTERITSLMSTLTTQRIN